VERSVHGISAIEKMQKGIGHTPIEEKRLFYTADKESRMNPTEEGYIKFDCRWTQADPLPEADIRELNSWRNRLYQMGLIGAYQPSGIGFGNISLRPDTASSQFIISGSATGHIPETGARHYARVTAYSIAENRVFCSGPVKASSESLTHAAVYELPGDWQAVIHVHHAAFWQSLLGNVPTSRAEIPYGTPEMAKEISRLFKEEGARDIRLMAMAGHEEGILSFGTNVADAASVLLTRYQFFTSRR
jgi:hypothetical protein